MYSYNDTVKPTVEAVTSKTNSNIANTVNVDFSEPIQSLGTVKINGQVKSATAIPINPVSGASKRYEMAITSPFATLSTRNLTVLIPAGIKDVLGNEVDLVAKTVSLVKDTIAPEIDLVRIIKDPSDNVLALVVSADSTLAAKASVNAAVLANDNRLIVGFSEALAAIPTSADFSIKINGKSVLTSPVFVAGTGSDAGKYVADLNTLLDNDGSQTYIDLDGDSNYVAANDIFVKTEASQSSFSMKTSPLVSSLTIEVVAGATTDTATPANALKLGTMITLK